MLWRWQSVSVLGFGTKKPFALPNLAVGITRNTRSINVVTRSRVHCWSSLEAYAGAPPVRFELQGRNPAVEIDPVEPVDGQGWQSSPVLGFGTKRPPVPATPTRLNLVR